MSIKNIFSEKCDINRELNSILNEIHTNGPINAYNLEKLAYIKKYYPDNFNKIEHELMYLLGLFYKTTTPKSLVEIFYKIYQDHIQEETGSILTPVQANAFNLIKSYKYFSFSAPTSIGKSYLFRKMIKTSSKDIVIIVPSRALLTEYILEIQNEVPKDVLVLQFVDLINKKHTKRHIFVLTPERTSDLFKYVNHLNVEFFLFDEAQISEESLRGIRFDALVRRVDKIFSSSKIVFAHPFVNNPEAQLSKHRFISDAISQNYHQQAVGKIYIKYDDDNNFEYFSPNEDIKGIIKPEKNLISQILNNNGTILIYIAKEKIYSGEYLIKYKDIIKNCPEITNQEALNLIAELHDYIGGSNKRNAIQYSSLIDMMKKGIVIHHGSIPLYGRLLIERFINKGFAKLCFSTSTLMYGINLPFDIVWIDYFHFDGNKNEKILKLKNLIGRAGRSSLKKNKFDFGYVFIHKKNIKTFNNRLNDAVNLSTTSLLDISDNKHSEDDLDLINAIRNNTFDPYSQLPQAQIDRIKKDEQLNEKIRYILDVLLKNGTLTAEEYYKLSNTDKDLLKSYIADIFSSHLRRDSLTPAEKSVLSTAIPIMLWRIQGRSFKHIVSMRYAYVTNQKERRDIENKYKNELISATEMYERLKEVPLKYTQIAATLPNKTLKKNNLFNYGKLPDFRYDILMYDTYDYLDKVISFSLAQPLAAAFHIYYDKTGDNRALIMENYIKYASNDNIDIYLQRYGFSFEEIDVIKPYVKKIDADEIVFNKKVLQLDKKYLRVVKRYMY